MTWVEKELELATRLHDAGLPVAGPVVRRSVPGRTSATASSSRSGSTSSTTATRRLDAAAAGAALRRIHDALADVDPAGLEHFARLDEIGARCRGVCRSRGGELEAFRRGLDAARKVVDGLDVPLQPIHGDAHHGNVMRTPSGPLWGDFENVCLGPRELDLACNELRARAVGREPPTTSSWPATATTTPSSWHS